MFCLKKSFGFEGVLTLQFVEKIMHFEMNLEVTDRLKLIICYVLNCAGKLWLTIRQCGNDT